jgi:hypothetical protein
MMKKVVISDTHNREFIVKDLFRKIGLMDDDGNRVDGFHVIQLGDLLSLGYNEQEAEYLKWVRPWIDTQLTGNHEYPALGPYSSQMEFVGWEHRDIVAEQMVRHEHNLARMNNDPNMWVPTTYVGDWLISHAGITPYVQKELKKEGWDGTAKEASRIINEMWVDHVTNQTPEPIFIGTASHTGGLFWVRIEYLRAGYRDVHVPQIVGHTPQKEPGLQNKDGNLYCIDTQGDCCALVTEDDGKTWDMVRSDYELRWWENPNGQRNGGPIYVRGTDELAFV